MEATCALDDATFPSLYAATFESLHFNGDQFREDFVAKHSLEDRTDEHVRGLLFRNCMVQSLSPALAAKFPRVTHIVFKDSSLENVAWRMFEKFAELRVVKVRSCTVELFLGTIFERCSSLVFRVESAGGEDDVALDAAVSLAVEGADVTDTFQVVEKKEVPPNPFQSLLFAPNLFPPKCPPKTAPSESLGAIRKAPKIDAPAAPANPLFVFSSLPPKPADRAIISRQGDRWKERCQKLEAHVLTLTKQLQSSQAQVVRVSQHAHTLNDLWTLLADTAFADFTIKVGETDFHVHKLLFAACSCVFADLVRNNPKADMLTLRDISVATFGAICDFLYKRGDFMALVAENLVEVFAAACRLKIADLRSVAAAQLLTSIDEKNALEILTLSNRFDDDVLRRRAFDVIQTRVFPERTLDAKFARQPDNIRRLVDMKRRMDEEFEKMRCEFDAGEKVTEEKTTASADNDDLSEGFCVMGLEAVEGGSTQDEDVGDIEEEDKAKEEGKSKMAA